jgi:CDGSH-type Zn-finger protein
LIQEVHLTDEPAPPVRPSIKATENGPYEVRGVSRIGWRIPVVTDEGESIAWRAGELVADSDQTYWLCRCGNSQNKPFCDGSHRRTGFAADDAADPAPRDERTKVFPGDGIDVVDDRSLCSHAGFCGTKATNVWKMTKRTDDTATRSLLVAMTQRCPSGALSARLADGGELEPPLPVEISLTPDGPLWATGGIQVERSDGVMLEVRNRMTLCRCGASRTKPLCDGSHSEVGFEHRP